MPTPQVSPTAPKKAGLQDDKRRLFVTILLIFFVIVAWQYVSYLSVAKKFNAGASAHAEAPVHLTLSREQAQRLRARGSHFAPAADVHAVSHARKSLRATEADALHAGHA